MSLYFPVILPAPKAPLFRPSSSGLSCWTCQAQIYKNNVGASSGAPAQDHFTYEQGPEIVKLALFITHVVTIMIIIMIRVIMIRVIMRIIMKIIMIIMIIVKTIKIIMVMNIYTPEVSRK